MKLLELVAPLPEQINLAFLPLENDILRLEKLQLLPLQLLHLLLWLMLATKNEEPKELLGEMKQMTRLTLNEMMGTKKCI